MLREKIVAALAAVEAELNIKCSLGNLTYSDTGCTVKLECAGVREDGLVLSKEANDLKYAGHRGVGPDDFGRIFNAWGKEYRLTGYRTRAKQYPYLVEEIKTGKEATLTASFDIRAAIDSNTPAATKEG